MDLFNALMRGLIGGYGSLFGNAHPLVSLAVLSILAGIGMLWVVGKTSDQKAIQRTKKRLQAYLLEMRLYGDDPSLLFNTQKQLFLGNLRYMGLMLRPALFLTVPMIVLLVHMDEFYGKTALMIGEPSVVTVQSVAGVDRQGERPRLAAPAEIEVETPAVLSVEPAQFSWRIRPSQQVSGRLQFRWGDREWDKSIVAGSGQHYLSSRRVSSLQDSFLYPGEDRLPLDEVAWVEVRYPPALIEVAGLELHWLIWFFLISIVTAYLLKGYFRVVI